MTDIDKDTFPKTDLKKQPHPLLKSLPDHLKDPANYDKIRKAILEAGTSKHSHGEVVEWAGCKHCQQKQTDRLLMMKKLGFQNAAQYMAWQKTHQYIKDRIPLAKYNTL